MTLRFQPLSEGAHKISIVATARLANGQSIVKSHMIPVYVDDSFQSTKQSIKDPMDARNQQPVASGGVIVMEAEETIE